MRLFRLALNILFISSLFSIYHFVEKKVDLSPFSEMTAKAGNIVQSAVSGTSLVPERRARMFSPLNTTFTSLK